MKCYSCDERIYVIASKDRPSTGKIVIWVRCSGIPKRLNFCSSCWGLHSDPSVAQRNFTLAEWIKFAGDKWEPYYSWGTAGDPCNRVVPKFHKEAAKACKL